MRESVRDPQRLEHIQNAIDNIFEFSTGLEENDLYNDKIRYFALVKNIEIIGEAAYMLTPAFKESHPKTEWRTIVNMRHTLVHGYYQISPSEVWNVIQNDLGPLREQIKEYRSDSVKA